ncbi:MAG: GNAT family N-acetyltransferase [Candidatus Levybacteria bacterium]|nr:GNAT family N-acetyltransferase [Candidatus Levybacteria bacterium]
MSEENVISVTSSSGSFSWNFDSFDSEILEKKTAKILTFSPNNNEDDMRALGQELVDSLLKENVEYVIYKIAPTNFSTIHLLEDLGFRIIDGSLKLISTDLDGQENKNITTAHSEDLISLQKLASESFSQTRYYNDPLVSKDNANKIYREWIKNSLSGEAADMVLIWKEADSVCGFLTLDKNGRIILIAVDKNQRGKGIGKALVKSALAQFKKWGITESTIETQMTNMLALKTYHSCGFKIIESYLTFRWSK